MGTVRSYSRDEAPDVEVMWDGHWCYGTLHQWSQDENGRCYGWVRFNVRPGENRIGTFDQNLIRPAPW